MKTLDDLVVHPATHKQLTGFLGRPSHALLLVAPPGAGKVTIARALAAVLLQTPIDTLNNHRYFTHVAPSDRTLSIDEVRNLQRAVQLKTVGHSSHTIRRVMLLEDAHYLTPEAQNALLKLLEEPPADTVLMLTTTNAASLLPTITSRAQRIALQTPARETLQAFLAKDSSPGAIDRAYNLGEGWPGIVIAMLKDGDEHPLIQAVETAKSWLRMSMFERLASVEELIKQKADLPLLLAALQRLAHAALAQAAAQQQTGALKRWRQILQATASAQRALQHNAQAKLLFTQLMLEL